MRPNRWVLLAVALTAQIMSVCLVNTPLFLLTYLHVDQRMSLASAGTLVAMPLVGATVSLVAWGAVVDRIGERRSMAAGLSLEVLAAFASLASDSRTWLAGTWFLLGVGSASLNSASGRLIVGWFAAHERGTVMGIRQTAQPLGAGLSAFLVPVLAEASGLRLAILVPALACAGAVLAVLALLVDPLRPVRPPRRDDNPYRGDRRLVRIHLASALLVIPQFTVWTFAVVWLVDAHGWSPAAAGALAAVSQLAGAAGRVGAGFWSDRVRSRMRPMRTVAVGAAVCMLVLGLTEPTASAVGVLVVASVVTVSDNGLAFTAVAEIGGPFWAGRAMGVQNSGQALTAAAVPPALGALITLAGYGHAFALIACFPLLAVPLIPTRTEQQVLT